METFYIIVAAIVAVLLVVVTVSKLANVTVVAAGSAVTFIIPLLVYGITTGIAKSSQETYYEFWNGSEIETSLEEITCERDGYCHNSYSCDPYTVIEVETYIDSEGDLQTRTVTKTKWHDCPYSTEETSYYINTTLGSYSAGSHLMTGTEFRAGKQIPGGRITEPPALWTEAKNRIDAGIPSGVTKQATYKNYILAADETLFKTYSSAIDDLKAENLLTLPASNIVDIYDAQKAYVIGTKLDAVKLSEDLQYLNGAVGTMLHGDVHIAFVDSNKAGDPTDYTNALHAYWTSEEAGKHALPKNTIAIVVGVESYKKPSAESATPIEDIENSAAPVNDSAIVEPENLSSVTPEIATGTPVVAWARAFTGMPLGNEALMTQIQSDLKGAVIDSNFIGRPIYDIPTATYKMSDGVVESILFGSNQFSRVSMDALEEDDNGSGFKYLSDAWEPDEGTMAIVFWISSILAGLALAAGVMVGYNYQRSFDPVREYSGILFAAMKKEKK